MKQLNTNIPDDLYKKIKIASAELGMKMQDFIIEALEDRLKKTGKKKE